MGKVYCKGKHCPVRNRCLRYTKGLGATMCDAGNDKYINRCTNQKMYVQDDTAIVKGR